MRIAILDSWPNLPDNAEREFIARFQIACAGLDIQCHIVVTSDDIYEYDPDLVLAPHEFSRKLTGYPTIGMIWSPLSFFRDDPYRVRSILSYDGYLAANESIRLYLEDIQSGLGARKPIAERTFLPTTYRNEHYALEQSRDQSVCYIGVHWDGTRHQDLFDTLTRRGLVTCYGPKNSWDHLGSGYGGPLPFDGRSVVDTIAGHGLALCLHKAEHRLQDTPSMRVFETLSVGAVPICDDIAFARKNLADFATFVDMTQPAERVADQIQQALDDVRRRPSEARARARRAKTWFDENWSLEVGIKDVIMPLLEEVRDVGRFATRRQAGPVHTSSDRVAGSRKPACEIVMRSGGRDLTFVQRAIESVRAANSDEFPLGMLVVDYRSREDLKDLCTASAAASFPVRYIQSPSTGYRSTALWDGLKAVEAPFVAHLDDDDTVFQNHYRQLAAAFERKALFNICYSGVIRVEDEAGFYFDAPNFVGPDDQVIKERREIKFLDYFEVERLAQFDNFIQSNAWMGRTPFVQQLLGDDPKLVVAEDVYLYLLMAAHGPFGYTGSPTAAWHWRSLSSDNSMLAVDQEQWRRCGERVKLRLASVPFQNSTTYDRLLNAPTMGPERPAPRASTPENLPPLDFGQGVDGGFALQASAVLEGFHPPESGGVWSKQALASVRMTLTDRVRAEGAILVVECLGAASDDPAGWLELSIVDGEEQRVAVADARLHVVELPLRPGSRSPMLLKVRSSRLVGSAEIGGGGRAVGGFIQAVRVAAQHDATAGASDATVPSGISGAWGVPIQGGLAHGALEARKGAAVEVTTSWDGRLWLSDGRNDIAVARSDKGRIFVPARPAQAVRWLVFQADDPEASGDLRFELTYTGKPVDWLAVVADGRAVIRGHLSLNDGQYQHAAISISGGYMIEANTSPFYFLIQRHQGKSWWETRPSYGQAWNVFEAFGEESSDNQGRLRRGELAPIVEIMARLDRRQATSEVVTSRDFAVVSIMRTVLVGAVNALAMEKAEAPQPFLTWLIDELSRRANSPHDEVDDRE